MKAANANGSFGFTLSDEGGVFGSATVATGDSNTWLVPSGSYELAENSPLPAYWSLTGVECDFPMREGSWRTPTPSSGWTTAML